VPALFVDVVVLVEEREVPVRPGPFQCGVRAETPEVA